MSLISRIHTTPPNVSQAGAVHPTPSETLKTASCGENVSSSDNYEHHGKVYDLGKKLAEKLRQLGHIEQKPKEELLPPDNTPMELTAEQLRKTLSPDTFAGLAPTSNFPKAGQERLLSALKMASEIENPGYNIFITRFGGDEEVVANLLKDFPPSRQNQKDFVYVRNFENVNQPSLLIFPAGKAKDFGNAVEKIINSLAADLPTLKGSSNYIQGRVDIEEKANEEVQRKLISFKTELDKMGFGMKKLEREDGLPLSLIGLKLLLPRNIKISEEQKSEENFNEATKESGEKSKREIQIVPMDLLESICSKMTGLGLNPVFVLQQTTAGPAYEIMGEKEYQDKVATPAVKLGQNPPPAYTPEAIRSQFSEFRRKSLELNAAQEAIQAQANKDLKTLLQREASQFIDERLKPLHDTYAGSNPYIKKYLDGIKESILKNLTLFVNRDETLAQASKDSDDGDLLFVKKQLIESFKPNVLITSEASESSSKFPIVYEKDPTWENLLGTIQEPNIIMGKDIPLDRHKNIKAGSLLKAQGGYLIVDLLSAARLGSLNGLLRAVRSGKLQIESPYHSSNRPEVIPLNVKVVVLDPQGYYDYLAASDKTFEANFIKAPYDTSPKADTEIMRDFARNLLQKAKTENLLPVNPSALASIMEEAMATRESQEHFTADFAGAMDLLREANAIAKRNNALEISSKEVKSALDARRLRHGLTEDRIKEGQGPSSENKPFVIETKGSKVGQINGLSVYMMHASQNEMVPKDLFDVAKAAFGEDWVKAHEADLAKAKQTVDAMRQNSMLEDAHLGYDGTFGGPSRITATASNSAQDLHITSNDLLPNWVGPSGKKAYTNLESFFKEKFGYNNKRLFGEGRLSFEQSYSGHDGDSATLAETIALLSAFSKIPIKQGIAITGSMDEHGMAQAIGGVNFKIAGFFDECQKQGLDGTQGVVIPASNAKHLMLRPDIVQAIKEGKFHIWTVKNIDEAVEILTGVKAGKIDPKTGAYEKGTVYGEVEKTLEEYRKNQQLVEEPQHHRWNIAK
jgi:predicted ATP-dependent protease